MAVAIAVLGIQRMLISTMVECEPVWGEYINWKYLKQWTEVKIVHVVFCTEEGDSILNCIIVVKTRQFYSYVSNWFIIFNTSQLRRNTVK